jgi:hypothetical protein
MQHIVHTRPRQIAAADVRQGDQLATFIFTGDRAGLRAAELDRDIVWLDVDRFSHGYGDTAQGVVLVDGTVKPVGSPFDFVTIREVVSVDC